MDEGEKRPAPTPVPERTRNRQDWLLPYENPLAQRLGREFFSRIPKTPGVYIMTGDSDAILYIGKAKNLRERLNSYRRAKPGQVSRKVIRLVNIVREIRWEECKSEKDALLRENRLLRDLKPPFNRLNVDPESYYFIGVRVIRGSAGPDGTGGCQVRFRLTCNPKRQGDQLFGAYKGRGTVRMGYSALLRLIWAAQNPFERWGFPARLTRRSPAYLYTTTFPADLLPLLKRFLNGADHRLLPALTEKLLENPEIPKFFYHVIQEDLEALFDFFERCPRRNKRLRRNHSVKNRLIPQEMIDDLLVMEMARTGLIDR